MNPFKLMSGLSNIGKMQQEIAELTSKLGVKEFQGKAGGDLVTVTMNGQLELKNCSIDPKLLTENDRELVEDLIAAAVTQATAAVKKEWTETIQRKLTENFGSMDFGSLLGESTGK